MSQLLLSVEECWVSFGPTHALNGLTLHLNDGEGVGLVGRLGAGKTTLLRLVAGLVQPSRGRLTYAGQDLRARSDARGRSGIAFVPADGGFFPSLTVAENLALANGGSAAATASITELFPVLGQRRGQRAGSLSGGEQRQLAIARGALGRPRLLLLDEPLLGLSPQTVQRVTRLLTSLRAEGVAMLVAEERPSPDLGALVDRMAGMRAGRLVPLAEVVTPPPLPVATPPVGFEHIELETLSVPLSVRDRRALQTLAQSRGAKVGELVAGLIREHVESNAEGWR